jgi:hypothetical protein
MMPNPKRQIIITDFDASLLDACHRWEATVPNLLRSVANLYKEVHPDTLQSTIAPGDGANGMEMLNARPVGLA